MAKGRQGYMRYMDSLFDKGLFEGAVETAEAILGHASVPVTARGSVVVGCLADDGSVVTTPQKLREEGKVRRTDVIESMEQSK